LKNVNEENTNCGSDLMNKVKEEQKGLLLKLYEEEEQKPLLKLSQNNFGFLLLLQLMF